MTCALRVRCCPLRPLYFKVPRGAVNGLLTTGGAPGRGPPSALARFASANACGALRLVAAHHPRRPVTSPARGICPQTSILGGSLHLNQALSLLRRRLQAAQRKSCPFPSIPVLRDHFTELRVDLPPHWVRPALVVEVEYRQRVKDDLRHAAQGSEAREEARTDPSVPLSDHGPL